MSYTTKIKDEIALSNEEYQKPEIIAETCGFIRNNNTITKGKIILTNENLNIINRITNHMKILYQKNVQRDVIENLNFSKKELYQITIIDEDNYILKDLGILDENNKYLDNPPSYILDDMETIKAYLKGVFLTTGSINDPKTSRYHMELLISKPEEAIFVQRLLNMYELNAKILNRDKGYMIYIKEAEKISDFIKILGANNAVLYYEDIRIYRDEKNLTNRLNNCEQANTDKIVHTASKQLKDIKLLEETASLSLLDDKCMQVVEYRKKYPEASLKELAEIISKETNKKITKSGLNHRLRKIKELAERIRKNQKS
ncbi:MAG: DNA-binding protein WhiA [Bacilli bacterium]|nr:DNA-binding protein WhiA [Bacilli bacterium]